jgi:hypothetical protein
MTTFALAATDLEDRRATAAATDTDAALPRSVANPRRTTWTGFAKDELDRLPAG